MAAAGLHFVVHVLTYPWLLHLIACILTPPPPPLPQVRCQRVIYGLLQDVSDLLLGASPKTEHEVVAGVAEVLQVFQLKGAR